MKVHAIDDSGKVTEYDYSPDYGTRMKATCLVANISELEDIHEINTYIRKIK